MDSNMANAEAAAAAATMMKPSCCGQHIACNRQTPARIPLCPPSAPCWAGAAATTLAQQQHHYCVTYAHVEHPGGRAVALVGYSIAGLVLYVDGTPSAALSFARETRDPSCIAARVYLEVTVADVPHRLLDHLWHCATHVLVGRGYGRALALCAPGREATMEGLGFLPPSPRPGADDSDRVLPQDWAYRLDGPSPAPSPAYGPLAVLSAAAAQEAERGARGSTPAKRPRLVTDDRTAAPATPPRRKPKRARRGDDDAPAVRSSPVSLLPKRRVTGVWVDPSRLAASGFARELESIRSRLQGCGGRVSMYGMRLDDNADPHLVFFLTRCTDDDRYVEVLYMHGRGSFHAHCLSESAKMLTLTGLMVRKPALGTHPPKPVPSSGFAILPSEDPAACVACKHGP